MVQFADVSEFSMRDEVRANELEERLIEFAARIIKLANSLPKSPAGNHIAGQLLRSGTSAAPNYAEARGAESRADFAHKLKIAVKELNECRVWMRMILRAELLKASLLDSLLDENEQLSRILNASVTTARSYRQRTDQSLTAGD
jgi:four helix bundle protein